MKNEDRLHFSCRAIIGTSVVHPTVPGMDQVLRKSAKIDNRFIHEETETEELNGVRNRLPRG